MKFFRHKRLCSVLRFAQSRKSNITYLNPNSKCNAVVCSEIITPDNRRIEPIIEEISVLPTYHTALRKVRIFGESDLISIGGNLLSDRYDINFSNFHEHNPYIFSEFTKNKCRVEVKHPNRVIDKAISLCGRWTNNYYHFLIDTMAKLALIEQCELFRGVPIIVDSSALRSSAHQEMLKVFNKTQREVIEIQRDESFLVRELMYLSRSTWTLDDGDSWKGAFMSRTVLEGIRSFDFGNAQVESIEKIFVFRGDNRLTNENEIAEVFREFGFEIVHPEKLSFSQQAQLFKQAKIIAGVHGAGFANTIFCVPSCKVIQIAPKELFKNVAFANIAYCAGTSFFTMEASQFEDLQYKAPYFKFYLNPAQCRSTLKEHICC